MKTTAEITKIKKMTLDLKRQNILISISEKQKCFTNFEDHPYRQGFRAQLAESKYRIARKIPAHADEQISLGDFYEEVAAAAGKGHRSDFEEGRRDALQFIMNRMRSQLIK